MAVQHRDRMNLIQSTFKATQPQLGKWKAAAQKQGISKSQLLRDLIDSAEIPLTDSPEIALATGEFTATAPGFYQVSCEITLPDSTDFTDR